VNARWRNLLATVVVAAIVLALVARLPHRSPDAAPAPPARPESQLALVWNGDAIDPEVTVVPKDHLARLTVTNTSHDTLDLDLAGYDDRVHARIAPGARWRVSFVADRPGEAFAWRAGTRVVGRLAVTGSHLEEGHR